MTRSASKSHFGCVQCKRRKVKCNEAVPACGNCVRRKEACSFLEVTQYLPFASRSPTSTTTSPSSRQTGPYERATRSLLEIELTHFFLVETLPSVVFAPLRQDIWRRSLFPLGLTRPEILDAHLATAALHKAATTNDADASAEYIQLAAELQASVLATFVPMLSSPSAETAAPLFALAALVTLWAFASGSLPAQVNITSMLPFGVSSPAAEAMDGTSSSRVSELIAVIKISRGVSAVVQGCRTWLYEQGLANVIRSSGVAPQAAPDPCSALDGLLQEFQQQHQSAEMSAPQLHLYTVAVERTRSYLYRVAGDANNKEVVLSWPVGLDPAFVDALSRHEPAALVVLAFWAASLHNTPRIQWWARGWASDVVAEIDGCLEERWRRHLTLPVAMVATPENEDLEMATGSMVF